MAPPTKRSFIDLPVETQKEIFSFVRKKDLLVAQHASASLHPLASARLYRDLKFTFTFPGEGYPSAVSHHKSEFRLPEALHTFLTSDHDYAQYVRSFSLFLPEQQTEENSRKAVSRYHVEEEANKLLNTTLLVMLRKTTKLETFMQVWDPSIELSGQVYQALSKISSLQRLYLRLDTKAVQRISTGISTNPSSAPTGNAPLFGNPSTTTPANTASIQVVVIKSSAQSQSQAVKSRYFSSFRGLRHLEILGMDDLGSNLEQIAACLETCSGTLKAVTLSLSQDLARRARKNVAKPAPQNPNLGEETPDDDDNATASDIAPPTVPTAPANDAEARKEKAVQDSVLAVLFGLEKRRRKAKRVDRALEAAALRMPSVDDTQSQFFEIIAKVKKQLLEKSTNPLGAEANQGLTELLDNISADFVNANKKALSGKSKGTKSHKVSISGNKSKKIAAAQQLALSTLPTHLQNLSNDDYALWAQQHAHLLGEDYLDFTQGPVSGLPVHSSSSSYPQSTTHPFSFSASSQTLPPHHYLTSSKPTPASVASSYPFGPYSSSVADSPSATTSAAMSANMAANMSTSANLPSDYQMLLLHEQHKHTKKQKYLLQKQHKKELQQLALEKSNAEVEGTMGALINNLEWSSEGSDTESDTEEDVPVSEDTVYFPPAEISAKDKEDEMDIDMDHPDVVPSMEDDSDPDQETIDDVVDDQDYDSAELSDPWTETSSRDKGKGKEVVNDGSVSPKKKGKGKGPANGHLIASKAPARGKGKKALKSKTEKNKLDEEDMQEYLRTTHGFQIEDFALYLIPIKASVMAKALELSYLKRICLLGVGPQGGFWTLMSKIHADSGTIQLSYIQTDDVSLAFLHAVSTFPLLESLYLLKRSNKDSDFTLTKNPGSIDDIRIYALHRHLISLKRLVINNQNDSSWDLNEGAVRLICGLGHKLLDLGVSIAMNEYHILLQNLPSLSNLSSLYIITLRISDSCHTAARETRKFTLDSFGHCPTLKIKHLVLHNQVMELRRRDARRLPHARVQAFGDGDALKFADASMASMVESLKKVTPADRPEWLTERFAALKAAPPECKGQALVVARRLAEEVQRRGNEMVVAKTVKFWDVESVEMFGKRVRLGKL